MPAAWRTLSKRERRANELSGLLRALVHIAAHVCGYIASIGIQPKTACSFVSSFRLWAWVRMAFVGITPNSCRWAIASKVLTRMSGCPPSGENTAGTLASDCGRTAISRKRYGRHVAATRILQRVPRRKSFVLVLRWSMVQLRFVVDSGSVQRTEVAFFHRQLGVLLADVSLARGRQTHAVQQVGADDVWLLAASQRGPLGVALQPADERP